MVKRVAKKVTKKLERKRFSADGGLYGIEGKLADEHVPRFHSGCTLFDCVVGGGISGAYPESRIVNIVGWHSCNKTGLLIEACANFAITYPDGLIRYTESEAAFDRLYARKIGLPLDRVEFSDDCFTVEDVEKDVRAFLVKLKGRRGLYILDSLDALSDAAELDRDIEDKSMGAQKAKKMSEFFRRLTKKMSKAGVTLIIVSQLRDKIGVKFGEKAARTGGKALDFYASWVVWLSHIGRIKRTVKGVQRVIGVQIRASCRKNKCSHPFRECDFPVIFNYGIDDLEANADWLVSIKRFALFDDRSVNAYLKWFDRQPRGIQVKEERRLASIVRKEWIKIEKSFAPKYPKYS